MPAIIILTRFNLYMRFGDESPPNLDRDWLEKRVQYFEQWCQPSVANQSVKEFRWVVMLDPQTPQDIVDRLNAREPAEAHRMEKIEYPEIAKRVREWAGGDDWVVTVNLDSDDMLHKDFVKELREAVERAKPEKKSFFVFPVGYTVRGSRYYKMRYPNNQFRALLEPTAECDTVYSVDHHKLAGLPNVLAIHQEPRWAMIVHGSNVANRVAGVRDLRANPEDFAQPIGRVTGQDFMDVWVSSMREAIRNTGIVPKMKRWLGRRS